MNENEMIEGQSTETETPKTYTEAEVQALLQKEGDRRVSAALKKAEQKNAEKVREAEKLAAMNADEKFRYELEQREKAIVEKENALAMAENKNVASAILADKGLSLTLVDFVVDKDADEMDRRIKILDKAFKASVKNEVEKRLGSNVPRKNLPTDEVITKEKLNKMSLAELQALKRENPEIYHAFYSK